MQEREILRGDRHLGLSNDQIDRVHQGQCCAYDFKVDTYDFKVDTSSISPFEAVREILGFVKNNPNSKSFKKIKEKSNHV